MRVVAKLAMNEVHELVRAHVAGKLGVAIADVGDVTLQWAGSYEDREPDGVEAEIHIK